MAAHNKSGSLTDLVSLARQLDNCLRVVAPGHTIVHICKGDEWKTVLNTPLGHFEYLVMLFGLTNAPAVSQALVNDVLRDMLNRFVFVYIDDVLFFSHTMEEHVRLVLLRLLEHNLFVKAEK